MAAPTRRAPAWKLLEHLPVPGVLAHACVRGRYWAKIRDARGNVLTHSPGMAVGEVVRRKKTGGQ